MVTFSIQHRKGYNGRLCKVKRCLISTHAVVAGSKEHRQEMDMGSETKLSTDLPLVWSLWAGRCVPLVEGSLAGSE